MVLRIKEKSGFLDGLERDLLKDSTEVRLRLPALFKKRGISQLYLLRPNGRPSHARARVPGRIGASSSLKLGEREVNIEGQQERCGVYRRTDRGSVPANNLAVKKYN